MSLGTNQVEAWTSTREIVFWSFFWERCRRGTDTKCFSLIVFQCSCSAVRSTEDRCIIIERSPPKLSPHLDALFSSDSCWQHDTALAPRPSLPSFLCLQMYANERRGLKEAGDPCVFALIPSPVTHQLWRLWFCIGSELPPYLLCYDWSRGLWVSLATVRIK